MFFLLYIYIYYFIKKNIVIIISVTRCCSDAEIQNGVVDIYQDGEA